MILAPLRLSSVAVSRPRPEVPPVIITVLPTRLGKMRILLLWGLKCASIYLDLLLHRGPFIKCFSEKYISPPIIHIIKHKHIIPIQIPENLMLLNVLKF